MKPLEMAARFAAFAWYTGYREAPSRIARQEATQFASQNWRLFLPVAEEGWGRLLLRVVQPRPHKLHVATAVSRSGKPQLAAAG